MFISNPFSKLFLKHVEDPAKIRHAFTFLDHEAPNMQTCPPNIIQETDPGKPTSIVVWEELLATDNSGDTVNVMCSHVSGAI